MILTEYLVLSQNFNQIIQGLNLNFIITTLLKIIIFLTQIHTALMPRMRKEIMKQTFISMV